MPSGPHATLVLPKKHASAITAIAAIDTLGEYLDLQVTSTGSKPHWVSWIEFYDSVAGTTLVLPTSGTLTYTVSPTSISGFDTTDYYLEGITNGVVTIAGAVFTTGPTVDWSAHTEVIRVTATAGVVAGATCTHFRIVAWEYYS